MSIIKTESLEEMLNTKEPEFIASFTFAVKNAALLVALQNTKGKTAFCVSAEIAAEREEILDKRISSARGYFIRSILACNSKAGSLFNQRFVGRRVDVNNVREIDSIAGEIYDFVGRMGIRS